MSRDLFHSFVKPIRKYPSLFSSFLFIILVSTISLFVLNQIKRGTKEQTGEALQTVLYTTQEGLHLWLNHRKDHLQQLLHNKDIISTCEQLLKLPVKRDELEYSIHQKNIRNLLSPSLELFEDQGIFIINQEYYNIASMRYSNLGEINLIAKSRHRLLENVFKGQILLIPPIQSDVPLRINQSYSPTMFIIGPLRNQTGQIIAALALRINPEKNFTHITQLGRLGKTGETYAFDSNGYLLTYSRFEVRLKELGLIQEGEQGITNIRISDPGTNLNKKERAIPPGKRPLTVMAKSALKKEMRTNTNGYRDYRGVKVFGTWLWDDQLGMGLTTEVDAREAMSPYFQIRNTIIFLISSTIILSLFFSYILVRIRIRTEKMLKKSNEELEDRVIQRTRALLEANETKTRFLHIIAHDLRTPITGVSQLSGLLLEEYDVMDDLDRKELIQEVVSASESTYNLLKDLLKWANTQHGKIQASPQKLDFISALEDSLSPLLRSAKNKKITIQYDQSTHLNIYSDPYMFTTVIRNLVSNAIKFSREGGRIQISGSGIGSRVEITIDDEGIGIPENLLPDIFRIDRSTSRPGTQNEPGSGLGLILCKEYVEQNRGRISVKSREGKGTTFTIQLPQAIPDFE